MVSKVYQWDLLWTIWNRRDEVWCLQPSGCMGSNVWDLARFTMDMLSATAYRDGGASAIAWRLPEAGFGDLRSSG